MKYEKAKIKALDGSTKNSTYIYYVQIYVQRTTVKKYHTKKSGIVNWRHKSVINYKIRSAINFVPSDKWHICIYIHK